jgi:phosphoglycolate phosphatase
LRPVSGASDDPSVSKSSNPDVRKSLDLIVFDLDGTLIDSRRDLADAANQVLQAHGCPPHSEEEIGRMVGDGAATLVARAFATAGQALPPGALREFLDIYNGRLLQFTRPYRGCVEMLQRLQPRFTLAVLTNKPRGATEEILAGLDLARFFGGRVRGGDGPLPRKPDPAALLELVATSGGAPATTLLVGDSLVDWQTAHAAGVRACLARYGFGFAGFPTDHLTAADLVIDAPSELPERLY